MHTRVADQEIYSVDAEAAGVESGSGVSWGAVFAGAAAAAALTLLMMILGFGLGLSAVSPWSYNVSSITATTVGWIAFTQLAASALGGYLAGRLRVKWAVHTDEVFFRDTAHGLLSWAIASLITAAIMAGAVRIAVGGALDIGTRAIGAVAPAVATATAGNAQQNAAGGGSALQSAFNPMDYYADLLVRAEQAPADANADAALRAEVSKIFMANLRNGRLSQEDRAYLASMVARRTGASPADAERRVDDVFARANKAATDAQTAAKQAADDARKAAAAGSLWAFVALLLGAFVASLFATFGGRQRDRELVLRSS